MIEIARWMGDRLWFFLLWTMRRSFIKRLERGSFKLMPEQWRRRAWENHKRQNAFARRWGRKLMRFCSYVLLVSTSIQIIVLIVMELAERAMFQYKP